MADAASTFGRDIRCVLDADGLFSDVTGLDVVRQDAIHRIMTDDVLGDDGSGSFVIVGWGFDVRRLVGMSASKVAAHQPVLVEVLTRDPRIETADVELTPVVTNGLADIRIRIACQTELGPFELIKLASELSADELVGQP